MRRIENSIVFFPCSNIKVTSKFYNDIIGLTVAQEQNGGMCIIFDTGYGYLGFCQYDDGRYIPSGPVGMCISLNCRNEAEVDRCYEDVLKKGADIIMPPQRQEKFPVYSCFLRDPDGYKVEFQRVLEGEELVGGRE